MATSPAYRTFYCSLPRPSGYISATTLCDDSIPRSASLQFSNGVSCKAVFFAAPLAGGKFSYSISDYEQE